VSRRHAQELSVVYVFIDVAIRNVDAEAGFAKVWTLLLLINPTVDMKAAQKGPTESWANPVQYSSGLTAGWSTRDPLCLPSSLCAGASFA
jgi:hypothetical protein